MSGDFHYSHCPLKSEMSFGICIRTASTRESTYRPKPPPAPKVKNNKKHRRNQH
ncbi:hypothetical protein YC2023_036738 [Brassica napus]